MLLGKALDFAVRRLYRAIRVSIAPCCLGVKPPAGPFWMALNGPKWACFSILTAVTTFFSGAAPRGAAEGMAAGKAPPAVPAWRSNSSCWAMMAICCWITDSITLPRLKGASAAAREPRQGGRQAGPQAEKVPWQRGSGSGRGCRRLGQCLGRHLLVQERGEAAQVAKVSQHLPERDLYPNRFKTPWLTWVKRSESIPRSRKDSFSSVRLWSEPE